MNITVSLATVESELTLALDLVAKIFSSRTNINQRLFRKQRKLDWKNFDFFKKDDVIVAKDFGVIVGVVRLVYRIVYIESQPYKMAGFTDVCISEEYRGRGISKKIMKYAINTASYTCDIALLFASKNVDYYYNKFGFWGVSTYNKIFIKNLPCKSTVSFQVVISNDLGHCNLFYRKNYSDLTGFMERTCKYWGYILEKCHQLKINFKTIIQDNELCGYCIYKENVIYEISYNSCVNIKDILAQFNSYSEIQIDIEQRHNIVQQLRLFDFTLHSRSCVFGGHMLKVLNTQGDLNLECTYNFFKINNKPVNFVKFNQF